MSVNFSKVVGKGGDQPPTNYSSTNLSEEGEECPEVNDDEKFRWKISRFKRAFGIKKYSTEFPPATKKVYMEKRRPFWLPQYTLDSHYYQQASYFSEVLAKDQKERQAIFDKFYRSNSGEYVYSKSDVVCKNYISKYLRGVRCVRFSPEGKYLIIGCGNGAVQIRHMQSTLTSVHCTKGMARAITSIRFFERSIDGRIFFASSLTGRVYMFKREKGIWKSYRFLQELGNEIQALDFNVGSTLMATGGKDGHVRVYDPCKKKLLEQFARAGFKGCTNLTSSEDEGHSQRVCALKFDTKDPNVLFTGGWDDLVKVWDVRTPIPVQTIAGPHLVGNSIDVMGRVLLTGQWTCTDSLQLWDLRSSKCFHTIRPLNRCQSYSGEFTNDVQFIRSWEGPKISIPGVVGDIIITTGSGTRSLDVISIKENVVLHTSEERNAVVGLDHNGPMIAYGSVNHLYSVISFFPFVGELYEKMEFPDKKTEEKNMKRFSKSGNPLGWHEVAFDLDFLKAFNDSAGSKGTEEEKGGEEESYEEEAVLDEEKKVITYDVKQPKKSSKP